MNNVMVRLEVDRATAIRAGKREYGVARVELDPAELTPEQRETLLSLRFCSHGREEINAYALNTLSAREEDNLSLPPVPDASIDSIRLLLDAIPPAQTERAGNRRAHMDKRIAKAIDAMRVGRRYANDEDREPQIQETWIGQDRYNLDTLLAQASPDFATRYRARLAVITAEFETASTEFQARRAARDAAAAATAERRRQDIAAWVGARGTESQRARLAVGLLPDDEIVADIERTALDRLVGFPLHDYQGCAGEAARSASAAEWETLANIRAVLGREPPMVGNAVLIACGDGDRYIRVVVTVGALTCQRNYSAGNSVG